MKSFTKTQCFWLSVLIVAAGTLPLFLFSAAFSEANTPLVAGSIPTKDTGIVEQWLVILTAFAVKPTYMLLSLIWITWLWRRHESDLRALRWGLIWFLGGETACAVNYLFFHGLCAYSDYLHSYGMAVGFSFITYAALEGVDLRIIKYSQPESRCAALSLCRACIKYEAVPCGLRRLFAWFIPATILVALMLPSSPIRIQPYRTCILGSPQDYLNPRWSQLFESRYCAWVAIALLAMSWMVLLLKKENPVALAKVLFAAAMGPLGFGFLRLFLGSTYVENQAWSNIWEETTEWIFVAGTGFVLWTFRESLFRAAPEPANGKTASPCAVA